jgi:hypothetical protein
MEDEHIGVFTGTLEFPLGSDCALLSSLKVDGNRSNLNNAIWCEYVDGDQACEVMAQARFSGSALSDESLYAGHDMCIICC